MKRGERRQPRHIRAWLKLNALTILAIAKDAGISDALMHQTINGQRNNRRVLRALISVGVPAEYLDLPPDIQDAA